MATAIRNIPTLFGNEAEAFLRAAEMVEANPVKMRISRSEMAATRSILTEAGLL